MIQITLLAGIQVLRFEVKAETRTDAIKIAKNEAIMMGFTNLSVIG